MLKAKIFFATVALLLTIQACSAASTTPPVTQTKPVIVEPTRAVSTQYVIVEPTFPPTESTIPLTEAEVPRVSLEEALTAYAAGAAIIVDVRSKQAYDASHIASAIHIGDFESNSTLHADKNQWIITYCT